MSRDPDLSGITRWDVIGYPTFDKLPVGAYYLNDEGVPQMKLAPCPTAQQIQYMSVAAATWATLVKSAEVTQIQPYWDKL